MSQSDVIDITDLANPVLNEASKAALAATADVPVDFDPQSILDEASQDLSLDDFGAMDFMPRLQLLCDEWGQNPDISNLGRLGLRAKLLLFARSRLLIQNLLTRHPEIHDVQITAPIIVAGLPRSGTTHLLNLMAADSRLRALPLWESYEPVPLPHEADTKNGRDPRWERCQQQWEMTQQLTPLLAAMHPMNPDHIHEELELMGPNFGSYNFEWLAHSPRWRDDYYQTDQTSQYDYMKTVLKILTWQDGDHDGSKTRWVLKCPQHLEQLPILLKTFPDATFPITHRDPVEVIQSALTMIAYGRRVTCNHINLEELVDYWPDRIHHLLEACVRDRHVLPDAQSIDVLFHEFMADDIAMVQRIYEKAGLEFTQQARDELNHFMAHHQRGKYGRVVYHLERDFGLSPEALRARFDFYFNAFAVAPPK